MTRRWTIGPRLKPIALCSSRSADFQKQGKLARIGVLRFVENYAKVVFPNLTRCFRMPHQFQRECDLIVIREHAPFEPELAIILLYFDSHAEGTAIDPIAHRRE